MKSEISQQTTQSSLQTLYNIFAEIELFAAAIDNVYFSLIHNSEHGVNASLSANGNAMNDYLYVFESKHLQYKAELREIFKDHIISEGENEVAIDVGKYCSDHNFSQVDTDRILTKNKHFATDLYFKIYAIKCMFFYSKLINQFATTPSYTKIETWDPYFAIITLRIINFFSDHNFEILPYISPLHISFTIETGEKILKNYSEIFTKSIISKLQAEQKQKKQKENDDDYVFENPFIKAGCKIEHFTIYLSNLKSKYLSENFTTTQISDNITITTIHEAKGYVSHSDHKFHAAIAEHEVLTMRNLTMHLSDEVLANWYSKTQNLNLKFNRVKQELRNEYGRAIEKKVKDIQALIKSDEKRRILSLFVTDNTTSLEQYIKEEAFKLSTEDFQNKWRDITYLTPEHLYTHYLNSVDGFSRNSLAYTSTQTGIMEWFEKMRLIKGIFFYTNRLVSTTQQRVESQNAVIRKFWKDNKDVVTNAQLANKLKEITADRIYVLLAEYADLEIYQKQYQAFLDNISGFVENMHLSGIRYIEKRFDILMQQNTSKQNDQQADDMSYFSSYMTLKDVIVNLYQQSVDAAQMLDFTKKHIVTLESEIKARAEKTTKLQQEADQVYDELMATELAQEEQRNITKSTKKKRHDTIDDVISPETNYESSEEETASIATKALPPHIAKYNAAISLPIYSKLKITTLEQARDEAMNANDNLYRTYSLSALCDAHLYRAKVGLKKYFKANKQLLNLDDINLLQRTTQSAKNALSYGRATNAQITMLKLKQDIVSGLKWHFIDDNTSPEINKLLTKASEIIFKSLEIRNACRTEAKARLKAENRRWYANKDLTEVSKAAQLWYCTKILSEEFTTIKNGIYDFGKAILYSSTAQTTASSGITLQNSTNEYKAFEFGALQKSIDGPKKI